MAEQKKSSRAEKAAENTGKKPAGSKSGKSGSSSQKKAPNVKTEYENRLSGSVVVSAVSAALFLLFVAISVNSEGVLLRLVRSVVLGLIGKVGFIFSIPALLYMAVIHAVRVFRPKTKVAMRSWCLVLFVLCCGCIAQLSAPEITETNVLKIIQILYTGGAAGTTAGALCGSIALFIRWGCGKVLSYVLYFVGIALTVLGAMEITIPSLIRAILNRPRDDWEEDEEEEVQEPAALVVNHIANRQIAHKRQLRERQRESAPAEEVFAPPTEPKKPRKKMPQPPASPKATEMLSQIEVDIDAPVAAAAQYAADPASSAEAAEPSRPEPKEEVIPPAMPPYQPDEPLAEAPKTERKGEQVTAKEARDSARQVAEEIQQTQSIQRPDYCYPPISLLRRPAKGSNGGTEEMRENSRRLNETLASFKIDAHIINVTRGPSVTRYEVELDKGVRLNKLTSCADDIALSLGASGVRIAAVPGKISIVGIEVPNRVVTTVSLREVIDSPEFAKSKSMSSFAVGKDIGGSCIIGDISKMPHMLIAGTTGSGKSVCMNSIIISLLYKAGPEDVKLIMVDPKMVELANYNGIPHLMIPVVTDPKKAAGSLQWAVTEMMRRYKAMSDAGVRDLESYNSIMVAEGGEKTPQLIVIIDELADLMLAAAKEVEDSICRIAQMGRAAGIHLVIATQRPSADVITGLMKANIPSRIAFSVASAMESRIILDTQGAEKLVGKGDMLFAPIGSGKPLRVQGCFVTDGEVEAVTAYVKDNYVADYDQDVLEEIEKKAQQTGKKSQDSEAMATEEELTGDELLPDAVDVILETGQASVSMLQRRLKLGYARAARIVDEMEEQGIVGPFQGSKPRAILITKEQWAARKSGGSSQMQFDDLDSDYGVPDEI